MRARFFVPSGCSSSVRAGCARARCLGARRVPVSSGAHRRAPVKLRVYPLGDSAACAPPRDRWPRLGARPSASRCPPRNRGTVEEAVEAARAWMHSSSTSISCSSSTRCSPVGREPARSAKRHQTQSAGLGATALTAAPWSSEAQLVWASTTSEPGERLRDVHARAGTRRPGGLSRYLAMAGDTKP